MRRVHRIFLDLDPVAGERQAHAGHHFDSRRVEAIVVREGRHVLRRAHVGEHHAVEHVRRVGALGELLPVARGSGLAGHLEDRAVDVVEAAVVAAVDSALLDLTVFQRSAAVAAV